MDRGEFIREGFSVLRAVNGGWVVSTRPTSPEYLLGTAAFGTFADMIAWLEDEYEGLKIGQMNQKGEGE